MTNPSETIIKARADLTEWLIHWTKKHNDKTALENLLSIISDGYIKSGNSIRNGRTTLYGVEKVVCFSQQPLWAFKITAEASNNEANIDQYGLIFHKEDLFAEGAMPVIYGLERLELQDIKNRMQLKSCSVNEEEYFRIITFVPNPKSNSYIDWTHEREWRWSKHNTNFTLPASFCNSDKGMSQGRVHIIVKQEEDVKRVQTHVKDLVEKYNQNPEPEKAEWIKHLKSESKIIIMTNIDTTKDLKDARLDSIDTNTLEPAYIQ